MFTTVDSDQVHLCPLKSEARHLSSDLLFQAILIVNPSEHPTVLTPMAASCPVLFMECLCYPSPGIIFLFNPCSLQGLLEFPFLTPSCAISALVISPLKYFDPPSSPPPRKRITSSCVLSGHWDQISMTAFVLQNLSCVCSSSDSQTVSFLKANIMPGPIFHQRILFCLTNICCDYFLHSVAKENILSNSRWEETNLEGTLLPVSLCLWLYDYLGSTDVPILW